uniref:Uncharacterized protein n=1 Tax=Lygus hesperus TaxID=30085 RepID=A0A0A9WLX2_LYGHE
MNKVMEGKRDCGEDGKETQEPRVEVIGGGWRTLSVSALIKEVLGVSRLGVSLDAEMAVAEGCAIMAEIVKRTVSPTSPSPHSLVMTSHGVESAPEDKKVSLGADNGGGSSEGDVCDGESATKERHSAHEVCLVNFEATNPDS